MFDLSLELVSETASGSEMGSGRARRDGLMRSEMGFNPARSPGGVLCPGHSLPCSAGKLVLLAVLLHLSGA